MTNMIALPTLKHLWLKLSLSLLAFLPVTALAVDTPTVPAQPPQITIVRQSGREDGEAQMIVKGKAHRSQRTQYRHGPCETDKAHSF
jgi:hypothetical protein